MIKPYFMLLAFLLGCSLKVYSQNLKPFTLMGKLPKNANGYIYLEHIGSGKFLRDSTKVKNGTFIFKQKILHPILASLSYNKKIRKIFIEPTTLFFAATTFDISSGKLTGSKSNLEYETLETNLLQINNRWKVVMDTLTAVNKRSNFAFQELKSWVLVPYFKEIKEVTYKFYNQYPSSYATAFSLQFEQRELSLDSAKLFFNRLPLTIKKSFYGANIEKLIDARKKGAINTLAANFSRIDINGTQLDLSNYKGKYVLLDFWGSWCLPCRKGNPHLRELYAKYKDKGIEFIGIAADDNTQEAWRRAVATDQLPWKHVLTGEGKGTNIPQQYNVVSYPTKILIDRAGKIIGRYGEEHTEMDKMFAKLFD